jgi:hypothetical protein
MTALQIEKNSNKESDLGQDILTAANAPAWAAAFCETVGAYTGAFSGRGIVICAGGVKYLTCAWVLVNILRQLRSDLPIEIWYLGEDEGDRNWIKLVEPLGVTCVNAHEVRRHHPHPRLGGWELKPYAILHSRFEEVLLLDADNVPAVDPTYLFDAPEYLEAGAVFWPDPPPPHMSAHPDAWSVFDVPHREEPEQESGQILIDKRRSWRALNLCDWYNQHSDFFYRFVWGDKDTFRFAWHRAGQRYAMPPRIAYIQHTICQGDFQGRLVFQHRHADKMSLMGNRRCAEFQHEEACLELVRQLAARWNPLLHSLRHLAASDWVEMERWAGHNYQFSLVGRRRWPISLLPGGQISGAGPLERYWWCESGRMMFARLDRSPSVVLEPRSAGSWHGRSESYGGAEIRLSRTRVRYDRLPQSCVVGGRGRE